MIETTAAEIAALTGTASRQIEARLRASGADVTATIKSLDIVKGSNGDSAIAPGQVFSSTLSGEAVYSAALAGSLKRTYELQMRVNGNAWRTIGYYTLTDAEIDPHAIRFQAQGSASRKLDRRYRPGVSPPTTAAAIIADIEDKLSITIRSEAGSYASDTVTADLTGYTYRQMIGYIAGLHMGCCTDDDQTADALVIRRLSTASAQAISASRITSYPTFEAADEQVTGISVQTDEETELTYGTVNLQVENPLMTETIFAAHKADLVGLTYRPGTVHVALGDFRLQDCDAVAAADAGGSSHTLPCSYLALHYDGGLSMEITAPPLSDAENHTKSAVSADTVTPGKAYSKARSAARAAIRASQASTANAGLISALDARVTALEQGGGGGSSGASISMSREEVTFLGWHDGTDWTFSTGTSIAYNDSGYVIDPGGHLNTTGGTPILTVDMLYDVRRDYTGAGTISKRVYTSDEAETLAAAGYTPFAIAGISQLARSGLVIDENIDSVNLSGDDTPALISYSVDEYGVIRLTAKGHGAAENGQTIYWLGAIVTVAWVKQ